jgi:transglutaminase-like putative cysteine protease
MFGIIQRLKEKTGLAYYLYPQEFDVTWEITLENKTSSSRDFSLVLPLPRDDFGQRILEGPEILPNPASSKIDPLFGNRYVVFSGNASARESYMFHSYARVAIAPRRIEPTQTFTLQDYSALRRDLFEKWTASSPHIDTHDPRFLRLASEAKKGASNVWSVIKNLNEYVIEHLRYGWPIDGLYSASDALEKDVVDCGGFDVLFIALCHALGIPARLVSGFWAGYRNNSMHAWVEVLLPNGQWVPADPSVEQLSRQGRTAKGGRLGFVGSNRLVISYGADIPIEIEDKKLIPGILQNPFLPFPEMSSYFTLYSKLETKRV